MRIAIDRIPVGLYFASNNFEEFRPVCCLLKRKITEVNRKTAVVVGRAIVDFFAAYIRTNPITIPLVFE